MSPFELYQGDCREILDLLIPDDSVDSIVTDPPYELGFMGKGWDATGVANDVETWRQALRVLKPGGHLLAFSGTRTYHRMVCAIEDAGFEVRDQIGWLYGSGFPKSLDVSKAIDKAAGAERVKVLVPSKVGNAERRGEGEQGVTFGDSHGGFTDISEPVTEAARQWQGWGTALKPAWEPIVVARKPLVGTVAANVLQHGTGAINVDGCRVDAEPGRPLIKSDRRPGNGVYRDGLQGSRAVAGGTDLGRWPANIIHDGSDEVLAAFPWQESGSRAAGVRKGMGFHGADGDGGPAIEGSSGSAARFFYCAKASKRDRDAGLEAFEAVHRPNGNKWTDQDYRVTRGERPPSAESGPRKNTHPTVKPTDLMRYLCRLVTPPGGTVLDPFLGSGSTGKAAMLEGFRFIGTELTAEYLPIARARINDALASLTRAAA